MARNLKAFRKSGRDEAHNDRQAQSESPIYGAELSSEQRANIEGMMSEYGGKSEAELMEDLIRMTEKQKKAGSFDASAMQKTAESIMPMLTPEQRQKLMGIMNMLGK